MCVWLFNTPHIYWEIKQAITNRYRYGYISLQAPLDIAPDGLEPAADLNRACRCKCVALYPRDTIFQVVVLFSTPDQTLTMYVHVNLNSLRYVSKPPTYTGQADVDAAVVAAQKGLATLAAMTLMEKSSLLHKLADQIELHADALAHIETLNLGMPIGDAKGNALAGVSTLRYSVPLPSPAPPSSCCCCCCPFFFPFLFFFFFVSVVVFAFFLLSYYCIMRTCVSPKYP